MAQVYPAGPPPTIAMSYVVSAKGCSVQEISSMGRGEKPLSPNNFIVRGEGLPNERCSWRPDDARLPYQSTLAASFAKYVTINPAPARRIDINDSTIARFGSSQ